MHNPFSIHSDRHLRALAAKGVAMRPSVSAEVLAATFGYRSSNAAREAAARGELTPPAATLLSGPGRDGLVTLLDPVAGLPFSLHASVLAKGVRDRHADYCASPYGNLLDVSALRGPDSGSDGDAPGPVAPAGPGPGPAANRAMLAIVEEWLARNGFRLSDLDDPQGRAAVEALLNRHGGSPEDGGRSPSEIPHPADAAHGEVRRPRAGAPENHRFATFLTVRRAVSPDAVKSALWEQNVTSERLGDILVRNGFLSRDEVEAFADEHRDRGDADVPASAARIPVDVLERHMILVAAESVDTLWVSTPSDRDTVRRVIAAYRPAMRVEFVDRQPSLFELFLARVRGSHAAADDATGVEAILDRVVRDALAKGASDIHVEPREGSYSVYFRKDGMRGHAYEGSIDECRALITQLKERARLDVGERRVGQDGGFRFPWKGGHVDLRVTTVVTTTGEQAVVRVPDPDRVKPRLGDLGIAGVDRWRTGISRRNGLCVACGAAGSGMTTTLSASASELEGLGRKVLRVDDDVECRTTRLGGLAADPGVARILAGSLKNFMRPDPDVVVFGEVRTEDAAANAVRAADTGHLVLATMRASSVPTALTRLRDLSVEPHELRYVLRGILAQTLVRTVCGACGGARSRDARTCERCDGRGYAGRTVVSQCAAFDTPSDVDEALALAGAPHGSVARSDLPWPPIVDDAVARMRAGATTSDELVRVFGSVAEAAFVRHGLDPADFALGKVRGEG